MIGGEFLMPKIVLYLMNQKGYEVLLNVVKKYAPITLEYVVLSEDPAVEKDYYIELAQTCRDHKIKYYERKAKLPPFDGFKFAIGWRWIIENCNNLVILHDSILPKYRGFSPLVNMLINGEDKIGVTALFADHEYDKGPIILQEKIKIQYPIKISKAIELVSVLYQRVVCRIIDSILNNETIEAIAQNETDATYSVWRDSDDYFIDWRKDSNFIKRSIDALGFPYGGARTEINDKTLTIDDADVLEDVVIENRHVGKIIFFKEGYPVVICGHGLLKITKARLGDKEINLSEIKFRTRFGGVV